MHIAIVKLTIGVGTLAIYAALLFILEVVEWTHTRALALVF
jgi:hypothetical protein